MQAPDIDESGRPGEGVPERVERLACEKALAARVLADKSRPIVAADTLIEASDGNAHGKPGDAAQARAMLSSASGQRLKVPTGMAFIGPDGQLHHTVVISHVLMRHWAEPGLGDYIRSNHWRGCAGGFSIASGSSPVEFIDGEFDAVCGLSTRWLKTFFEPSAQGRRCY